MPTKWYDGSIIEINQLTTNTKQFFIKIQIEEAFDFLPGQFVTLDLPVSEKRLDRWRSYSIANHPMNDNILELCIVRSDRGLGTKYLFEEVNVGSMLKMKGPDGSFTLPSNLQNEIIMVCTGTGLAPFRSMIRHIMEHKLTFHKIHLIFGTRNFESILYHDEFTKLAGHNTNFLYDVALSREDLEGFHFGYVHDIYLKKCAEVQENRHFYLCGWSNMIDEATVNIIQKMGYDKSQVHYELYG